jgi:ribosomal-protein-alanine N-acetyltransferase
MKIIRPPFNTFPNLKSHRLNLREVLESDLEHLIEISFYDGIPAKDIKDAQTMNERIRQDYMSSDSVHWLISSVESGEILGTCGFYRGFQKDIGEIGYVLKKAHRGKGYMSEAISLALAFGWIVLGLKAIRGVTSKNNLSSMNILKKAGFKELEIIDDEILLQIMNPTSLSS